MTQILPYPGADVTAELETAAGVPFPRPGQSVAAAEARIVWSGRNEALLLGRSVTLESAVCVDQSDGYAALEVAGRVEEVLARLTPLDLRPDAFPAGATARSLLRDIPLSLTRMAADRWLLLVPRSMAASAVRELREAAAGLVARP